MEKRELLFDGNEKQVFATDNPELVIFRFKDVITAYNNVKRARVARKGIVSNAVSSLLFEYLRDNGVHTHFVSKLSEREQLCHKICIIPIELIVRNRFAGEEALRLGIEDGFTPPRTVYNLRYNNTALGNPLINDSEAEALGIASEEDLKIIYATGARINSLLSELFRKAGIELIDFKLEFGRLKGGAVVVSDEISPDTCRLWDQSTGERLDKDRFRFDLGSVVASYQTVYDKLIKIQE